MHCAINQKQIPVSNEPLWNLPNTFSSTSANWDSALDREVCSSQLLNMAALLAKAEVRTARSLRCKTNVSTFACNFRNWVSRFSICRVFSSNHWEQYTHMSESFTLIVIHNSLASVTQNHHSPVAPHVKGTRKEILDVIQHVSFHGKVILGVEYHVHMNGNYYCLQWK
jgi:hypothetical protein